MTHNNSLQCPVPPFCLFRTGYHFFPLIFFVPHILHQAWRGFSGKQCILMLSTSAGLISLSKRAEIKKWDILVWILTVLRGLVHGDDCNTEGLGNERKRAQPTETATSPVSFHQRAHASLHQPSLARLKHTHLRARKWIWVINNRASQKEQQRISTRCTMQR